MTIPPARRIRRFRFCARWRAARLSFAHRLAYRRCACIASLCAYPPEKLEYGGRLYVQLCACVCYTLCVKSVAAAA
jgi:hypothetical protein